MKKSIIIKTIFFSCSFLFFSSNLFSQEVWSGMGDGTSWNDAANWESNTVPAAGALVEIGKDVTITGTATDGPSRISIKANRTVTLDLDLTIGDGVIEDQGITVSSKSTLNLGGSNNVTFNFNQPSNKQGIAVFGGSDSVTVNILPTTTLQINSGLNGINISNSNSQLNNNGTINIENQVKNGIKTFGTFFNNGNINITNTITDAIQVTGGSFENSIMGTVTASTAGDDVIELLGDCVFTNFGILDLVAQDSSSSGNNAIAVGKDTTLATFINEMSGIVMANGGLDTTGRAISVNALGTLSNLGAIELSGGFPKSRIYNRGNTTNELGGIIDLQDGRMNINQGTFTNNGLVQTTIVGSGIFTNGAAINNAFFDYANSNNFSSGMGTITDNGVNVNNATVDASGNCTIDIAEAIYEYFNDNNSLGFTDANGALTFADSSLTGDSILLTTTFDGIEITVINICSQAIMDTTSTSIFTPTQAKTLFLFPSLVSHHDALVIDLSEFNEHEKFDFDVIDLNGNIVNSFFTNGGTDFSLNINDLSHGMYFIRSQNSTSNFIGKFIIAR